MVEGAAAEVNTGARPMSAPGGDCRDQSTMRVGAARDRPTHIIHCTQLAGAKTVEGENQWELMGDKGASVQSRGTGRHAGVEIRNSLSVMGTAVVERAIQKARRAAPEAVMSARTEPQDRQVSHLSNGLQRQRTQELRGMHEYRWAWPADVCSKGMAVGKVDCRECGTDEVIRFAVKESDVANVAVSQVLQMHCRRRGAWGRASICICSVRMVTGWHRVQPKYRRKWRILVLFVPARMRWEWAEAVIWQNGIVYMGTWFCWLIGRVSVGV